MGRLRDGWRVPRALSAAATGGGAGAGDLLAGAVVVVLVRAGLVMPEWSDVAGWLIWLIVAFSAVSLLLNAISPSAGERKIWTPVAAVMLVSSLVVAAGGP